MFSCCHPQLPEVAQVALMLNIVCGFGVGEVAAAFLSGHAAMEKRIARGKKMLAGSMRLFALTDPEHGDVAQRLSAVQRALYLLFNEGYHGAHAQSAVRAELCVEAMRLAELLLAHEVTATPSTHALIALMYLNAARLPTRIDASGNLSSLYDQDRSRWDRALIARGEDLFDRAAIGTDPTEYHLEAAIASMHASATSAKETRWDIIISLYDTLLALRPSPVVALNRAIAVAQLDGPVRGLTEIEVIADRERLSDYPFYFAAMGELELQCGRTDAARGHLEAARALARSSMERTFFEHRIAACGATAHQAPTP